jgi:hypothetical protein
MRAAMPHSWLDGNTQAPGGGLPASRMHQVPAFAGAASRMKVPPKGQLRAFFSVCLIHFLRLNDHTLDKTPLASVKQNNSKVLR